MVSFRPSCFSTADVALAPGSPAFSAGVCVAAPPAGCGSGNPAKSGVNSRMKSYLPVSSVLSRIGRGAKPPSLPANSAMVIPFAANRALGPSGNIVTMDPKPFISGIPLASTFCGP